MAKQWISDDITFCTNTKCPITKCMRNQKNIRHWEIPHSVADFDGKKDFCLKAREKGNG